MKFVSNLFFTYIDFCKPKVLQGLGLNFNLYLLIFLEDAMYNNYRCSHRNFLRNKRVKQESFHAHFTEGLHQGESDWEVRLIDQGFSVDDVRRRESYWQHELDTFQPNGLNEREVPLF